MPKPAKGEKKQNYISRCIPEVIGESKPPKEAAGKCYGMYDFYKKKKGKKKKNETVLPKFTDFLNENVPAKLDWEFSGMVEIDVNGEKRWVPVYNK